MVTVRNPRKGQFSHFSLHLLSRDPVFHMVFLLFFRAFPMFSLLSFPVSYFRYYGQSFIVKKLSSSHDGADQYL